MTAELDGYFKKEDWFRSLDLEERAKIVVDWDRYDANDKNQELLRRWKAQAPFDNKELFAIKLFSLGLSECQFDSIVLEKAKLDISKAEFSWLDELRDAIVNYFELDTSSIDLDYEDIYSDQMELCAVAKPLINRRLTILKKKMSDTIPYSSSFDGPLVIKTFIPILLKRLTDTVDKSVVHEMHFAKKQGWLQGSTSRERFKSFVKLFEQPEYCLLVLRSYPCLARKIVKVINDWADFCLDFFQQLESDYLSLKRVFGSDCNLGLFDSIVTTGGDAHNDGRSVLLVKFTCGKTIVYKPRPLDIDRKFSLLLEWLNERTTMQIKPIKVVDSACYGWLEYIEAKECSCEEDVDSFFKRYGGLTAVLYCLQGTDIHNENLIACGPQPVVIDLESILHPVIRFPGGKSEKPAHEIYSLNDSGLIPQIDYSFGDKKGYDMSALSGIPGQLDNIECKVWDNRLTDEMRNVNDYKVPGENLTEASGNLVKLNARIVNPLSGQKELKDGFTEAYDAIKNNRDTLMGPGGLISQFFECETRCILRDSISYCNLLYNLNHPRYLTNALEQDCTLDVLWLGHSSLPEISKVIAGELIDLKSGNIPIFYAKVNETNIYTSTSIRLRDTLLSSAMNDVRTRLSLMGKEDLSSQLQTIQKAFEEFEKNEEIQKLYK